MGRIIVGIDGSRDSEAALLWAAAEARLHGEALTILYAIHTPATPIPFGGTVVLPPTAELKEYGDSLLQAAAALVDNDHPGVGVTTELVVQPPVMALLAASKKARLLVLGSRGLGAVGAVFLGSVSTRVAARSACPTIVVRADHGTRRTTGPIVVGVDGSPPSEAALRFALAEAGRRGTDVDVVHAFHPPTTALAIEDINTAAELTEQHRQQAERHLRDILDRLEPLVPPGVKVNTQIVLDDPAEALIRMSDTAALVVVGSRGRGAFAGMLLGSVSQRLLHRAQSPVVVVHDGTSAETDLP